MSTGSPRRLPRFAAVGATGFLVDAGLLTLLVNGLAWGHYAARALSFSLAVTVTWLGNRRWVFEATHDRTSEYARYFSVQVCGAILNLSIYVLLIEAFPALAAWPVAPLAAGAAISLIFTFALNGLFVFANRQKPTSSDRGNVDSYGGVSNLEVMEQAEKYNGYLVSLIEEFCGTGKLLDFGAGTGTFASRIAKLGLSIVCVEPDAGLRGRLTRLGLPVSSSLTDIPADSTDFIYSFNVLEHIDDDVSALRQLRRCLKPDGRLLIYVPAFQLLFGPMDEKVGHCRRYRKRELEGKITEAGFDVQLARYVDCLGFLAALTYKAFGDGSGELSPSSIRFYDRWMFPLSRALDLAFHRFFGKNLLVVATAENSGQFTSTQQGNR